MNEQNHKMVLAMTHVSGMQAWYCPTCGRRILFLVPPNNEMVLVEEGNPYATHSRNAGGLKIGAVNVMERDEESEELSKKRLRPWIKALEDIDLDW
jgi:hypothetical protein